MKMLLLLLWLLFEVHWCPPVVVFPFALLTVTTFISLSMSWWFSSVCFVKPQSKIMCPTFAHVNLQFILPLCGSSIVQSAWRRRDFGQQLLSPWHHKQEHSRPTARHSDSGERRQTDIRRRRRSLRHAEAWRCGGIRWPEDAIPTSGLLLRWVGWVCYHHTLSSDISQVMTRRRTSLEHSTAYTQYAHLQTHSCSHIHIRMKKRRWGSGMGGNTHRFLWYYNACKTTSRSVLN